MRKEKSWTRRQYETAYRLCRRTAAQNKVWWLETTPPNIMQAADYSYQAKRHDDSAWISTSRRKRFHAIKYRDFAFPEDIPF